MQHVLKVGFLVQSADWRSKRQSAAAASTLRKQGKLSKVPFKRQPAWILLKGLNASKLCG
jgi:hypothetical protein